MSEYISRNTILKVLADSEPKEEDWRIDNAENYDLRKIRFLAASNVYEEIKEVLSCNRLLADVAPVVHGHWVKVDIDGSYCVFCPRCRTAAHPITDLRHPENWLYCPDCGAKMDEKEDSGND